MAHAAVIAKFARLGSVTGAAGAGVQRAKQVQRATRKRGGATSTHSWIKQRLKQGERNREGEGGRGGSGREGT